MHETQCSQTWIVRIMNMQRTRVIDASHPARPTSKTQRSPQHMQAPWLDLIPHSWRHHVHSGCHSQYCHAELSRLPSGCDLKVLHTQVSENILQALDMEAKGIGRQGRCTSRGQRKRHRWTKDLHCAVEDKRGHRI